MNRRHFISKSSLAILAAAGLPKAIFSKPNAIETYKTELKPGIAKQLYYELQIEHLGFRYFATAKPEEKLTTLKVAYYETTDITKPTKEAVFNYVMQESIEQTDGTFKIKAKFDKKVSGDYTLPKEFSKNISLLGNAYSYFKIIDKKEAVLVNMVYYTPPASSGDEYDGCFLTTACVQHKQLADDCDELNTLRFLRDTYMKQDAEGIVLANDYKIIGPKIVKAINRFDNKAEIYNYMFDNLVEPSVKLIKAKRYAEATAYYKDFVVGLTKKYL